MFEPDPGAGAAAEHAALVDTQRQLAAVVPGATESVTPDHPAAVAAPAQALPASPADAEVTVESAPTAPAEPSLSPNRTAEPEPAPSTESDVGEIEARAWQAFDTIVTQRLLRPEMLESDRGRVVAELRQSAIGAVDEADLTRLGQAATKIDGDAADANLGKWLRPQYRAGMSPLRKFITKIGNDAEVIAAWTPRLEDFTEQCRGLLPSRYRYMTRRATYLDEIASRYLDDTNFAADLDRYVIPLIHHHITTNRDRRIWMQVQQALDDRLDANPTWTQDGPQTTTRHRAVEAAFAAITADARQQRRDAAAANRHRAPELDATRTEVPSLFDTADPAPDTAETPPSAVAEDAAVASAPVTAEADAATTSQEPPADTDLANGPGEGDEPASTDAPLGPEDDLLAAFDALKQQAEAAGYAVAVWPHDEPHGEPVGVNQQTGVVNVYEPVDLNDDAALAEVVQRLAEVVPSLVTQFKADVAAEAAREVVEPEPIPGEDWRVTQQRHQQAVEQDQAALAQAQAAVDHLDTLPDPDDDLLAALASWREQAEAAGYSVTLWPYDEPLHAEPVEVDHDTAHIDIFESEDPDDTAALADVVRRLSEVVPLIAAEAEAKRATTAATGAVELDDAPKRRLGRNEWEKPQPQILTPVDTEVEVTAASRWRPPHTVLTDPVVPSGTKARALANLAALRLLRDLESDGRGATEEEQQVLARWSGWGAVPDIFDESKPDWEFDREQVRLLLTDEEYRRARASTINAHYTDFSYVQAMWDGLAKAGFTGGSVLEPGCGSGNFMALAPDAAHVTGVEVDPITAGIARHLHPHATVVESDFSKVTGTDQLFDATVGNVPFGDFPVYDKQFNPNRHNIHNYFVLKALHLTRPGGLAMVLTSRYTMDAVSPAARREIGAIADLVGAVRLPSGAHQRAAGTKVVTDVLVFRRREADREPAEGLDWDLAQPLESGSEVRVNEYFHAHPQHVLGRMSVAEHGMYGRYDLAVAPLDATNGVDDSVGEQLRDALADIADRARRTGLAYTPRDEADLTVAPAAVVTHAEAPAEGLWMVHADGTFTQFHNGQHEPVSVPKTQAGELRALIGMRDTTVRLLAAEAASREDTSDIAALRADLKTRYGDYVAAYGPINRVSLRRTGRTDAETGEEKLARIRPKQGGFRTDPHCHVVFALEEYDAVSGTARGADILTQRVIMAPAPRLGASNATDALAICLDRLGRVDLDEIASLLGVEPAEARIQLGQLVYDDPGTGALVTAAEYLSGDVRAKLAAAQAAAGTDNTYQPNVAALEQVIPSDLGAGDIQPRLGAVWIPAADIQNFLRILLKDDNLRVEHAGGATWAISGAKKAGVLAAQTWGTSRMSAPEIVEHLLTQRPITVVDHTDEGSFYNATETAKANTKAEAIAEEFDKWIFSDVDRTNRLVELYNRTFNATVVRTYDGNHLTFPGLSMMYTPRPHQREAVARMIAEPSVLLAHEVGAGKTLEMVMGVMELKRLGMVTKPAISVPNHMLEQFTREWLAAYPQANLLTASSKDLTGDKRRLFTAKCATGNWDAVIFTHGAFERIPMSRDAEEAYFKAEIDQLYTKLHYAQQDPDNRTTIKQVERVIKRAEERLEKLMDKDRDTTVYFEQTGIDYVVVDEAHLFKNLRRASVIPAMNIPGSGRATDLHMKLEHLRRTKERVGTFATATPLPNSMGEVHTMMRYLRPDLLEAQDLLEFDAWAGTFGVSVTEAEVAPEGGIKQKTRFARFVNVPELLGTFHIAGDIKTAEDLDLPVPELAPRGKDGQQVPETVLVPSCTPLKAYMKDLEKRADKVRGGGVEPSTDNLLKIAGDGRGAAMDVRLRSMLTNEPQKIDIAADKITEIWTEHRDDVFPAPGGGQHPNTGGLQLVFADLGTPSQDWNVYDELKNQLVARGMDATRIRFVHEAKNDIEKGELFAACRNGEVDVLIGSTARMGVGTNVQLRAAALHHLDCPWRPADVRQREGRIIRQGNHYQQVRILRYATEGSFDAFMWQTVARKSSFIDQVMRGSTDVREIEDIDEATMSYNEIKALASGNPLLLEHANAKEAFHKLDRASRAHVTEQQQLKASISDYSRRIEGATNHIKELDRAIARRVDTRGKNFKATIDGSLIDTFSVADEKLKATVTAMIADESVPVRTPRSLGSFAGFSLVATVYRNGGNRDVAVELAEAPNASIYLSSDVVENSSPLTVLRNQLNDLDDRKAEQDGFVQQWHNEIELAKTQVGAPFPKAVELEAARLKYHDLEVELAKVSTPKYALHPDADNATEAAKASAYPEVVRLDAAAAAAEGDDAASAAIAQLRIRAEKSRQAQQPEHAILAATKAQLWMIEKGYVDAARPVMDVAKQVSTHIRDRPGLMTTEAWQADVCEELIGEQLQATDATALTAFRRDFLDDKQLRMAAAQALTPLVQVFAGVTGDQATADIPTAEVETSGEQRESTAPVAAAPEREPDPDGPKAITAGPTVTASDVVRAAASAAAFTDPVAARVDRQPEEVRAPRPRGESSRATIEEAQR